MDRPAGMSRAHSRIRALATRVPPQACDSLELERRFRLKERFGFEEGVIEAMTGVRRRHLAAEGERPSSLAVEAAREALRTAAVAAEELDVIVYAAISRDAAEPATAHRVQQELGARHAYVMDVSNACLSMMDGVFLLDSLIASGRCRLGLVCGCDLTSASLRATERLLPSLKTEAEFAPYFSILTCGDGAAAMVLEPAGLGEGRRFEAFEFSSQGEHHRLCVLPALGEAMKTDGRRLYRAGASLAVHSVERVLARTGWTREEVDLVVPHQIGVPANLDMFEAAGIGPEKCELVVDMLGNTASTTIPLALDRALSRGRLERGMKVLMGGVGSGISAGFATLTW